MDDNVSVILGPLPTVHEKPNLAILSLRLEFLLLEICGGLAGKGSIILSHILRYILPNIQELNEL